MRDPEMDSFVSFLRAGLNVGGLRFLRAADVVCEARRRGLDVVGPALDVKSDNGRYRVISRELRRPDGLPA